EHKIDRLQQTTAATSADRRTDKIERWLRPPDPSTNANHARKLRHGGTGAWLLEHPVFQDWYSGSRRHLWLHGLAGCGKTVLSATVLDHLAKGSGRLILSFFFDFGDKAKKTVDGMLRSLVFQLYRGGTDSARVLDASFQAHQDGRDQPSTKALSDALFTMLAAQEQVVIVLDALDESTSRDELLRWIKDTVSRQGLSHVQIVCTSRPESEFQCDMPSLMGAENSLALDKQSVNADIRSYVAAQLSERRDFRDKRLSPEIRDKIQRKVGDGADGMFRWAFCQLESLARCRHEAAIVNALASLPPDLAATYRRMIESIPTELKTDAMRLLQFLVHMERPLTLAEAKEVIATQIENEPRGFDVKRRLYRDADVLDYCPSLVTVVHATDDELHLAHFSVKEYLLREKKFNIINASSSITSTCLTYLTDIKGSHQGIKQDFPMARCTAKIWTRHAALARASKELARAIVQFLENEETFQRWACLYQPDRAWDGDPGPPQGSQLYYVCFDGLVEPARGLIAQGADVDARGGEYGNALQSASYRGHQDIVVLLLNEGANVNAQGGHFGNALQAASSQDHQEIVGLLLDKGADVNAHGGEYGNPLQAASLGGHQEMWYYC
ncbi:unnamed protein product, partial [Clonostachys rosea f. rosea IK726]